MPADGSVELVLLHALPLDASMWAGQRHLLPGATFAPTLYPLGDRMADWASAILKSVKGRRLVVVGCSIGGSCALELAAAAPERVAALVLIGTKAVHRPEPAFRDAALDILAHEGVAPAWQALWAPLFPTSAACARDRAAAIALRQSAGDLARAIRAFHSRPSRDDILAAFPGPVTIVTGADDRFPGPAVSSAQARLARRGTLHVLPGCGHYVPLEQPAELNAIVSGVLATL
ncbi:pimeloyl-[acyl-carrier protein] methyl ester esterase [Ancylobacter sp. 3268]|uniref:alpha/beta fold hydrolase n=1 Tax=Ancylobacter sp. 3268 TaxID=2817752 RepID=UPI002857C47E|nr:alpha/beta hydrolase [Ancylobacter sp. 3268]MDR6951043.1 pimeloyl-[acyl-carrier protein] methyl ester esterase [Ancylobacter sp. 3268]